MKSFRAKRIVFLGEQDGPAERELKSALNFVLNQCAPVKAAYLLRVSFMETPGVNVGLGIYPKSDSAQAIAAQIAETFKRLFGPTQHLDILFLDEEQKSRVEEVAKPFYRSDA